VKKSYTNTMAGASLAVILAGVPLRCRNESPGPRKPQVPAGQTLSLVSPRRVYKSISAAPPKPSRRGSSGSSRPGSRPVRPFRKKIGKHYAGPTWESNDGSKVVGEVKARDDGPAPTAIPWLLLSAKSTSGNGAFSPDAGNSADVHRRRESSCGGLQPGASRQGGSVAYKATYTSWSKP